MIYLNDTTHLLLDVVLTHAGNHWLNRLRHLVNKPLQQGPLPNSKPRSSLYFTSSGVQGVTRDDAESMVYAAMFSESISGIPSLERASRGEPANALSFSGSSMKPHIDVQIPLPAFNDRMSNPPLRSP